MGDVLTGIFAPLVAYWWFVGKPYARAAAIAWNLFGMADLVNAVTIGSLTGGGGVTVTATAAERPSDVAVRLTTPAPTPTQVHCLRVIRTG